MISGFVYFSLSKKANQRQSRIVYMQRTALCETVLPFIRAPHIAVHIGASAQPYPRLALDPAPKMRSWRGLCRWKVRGRADRLWGGEKASDCQRGRRQKRCVEGLRKNLVRRCQVLSGVVGVFSNLGVRVGQVRPWCLVDVHAGAVLVGVFINGDI